MKKFIFFIFLVINSMNVFSFSKNKNMESVQGTVCAMGNELFVFPGIVLDDGRKFFVDASESVKKEILTLQGKSVIFEGEIYFLDENQNKIFENSKQKENLKNDCYFLLKNYKIFE